MENPPNIDPDEDLDAEMAARAASPVIPPIAVPDLTKPVALPPQKVQLPICRVCQGELDEIRTLDYGHLSVVMHTKNRCVVGVLYAHPKDKQP